jgi:hypothetical protein
VRFRWLTGKYFRIYLLKRAEREGPGKNPAKKGKNGEKREHLSCAPPCSGGGENAAGPGASS